MGVKKETPSLLSISGFGLNHNKSGAFTNTISIPENIIVLRNRVSFSGAAFYSVVNLEESAHAAIRWFDANRIKSNHAKAMIFNNHSDLKDICLIVKLLGVFIDYDLNFTHH